MGESSHGRNGTISYVVLWFWPYRSHIPVEWGGRVCFSTGTDWGRRVRESVHCATDYSLSYGELNILTNVEI
jgi:hypothetical protein